MASADSCPDRSRQVSPGKNVHLSSPQRSGEWRANESAHEMLKIRSWSPIHVPFSRTAAFAHFSDSLLGLRTESKNSMKRNPSTSIKMPVSLAGIGGAFLIVGLIGMVALPWHASIRPHCFGSSCDDLLRSRPESVTAVTIVASIYLVAIWIGIGCFRSSRWIRWYVPGFPAGLAGFAFLTGHPWEGVWSLAWIPVAFLYFFRRAQVVDYFEARTIRA